MDIDEERAKIGMFIKTGLVVLSIIILLGIIGGGVKKAITVSKVAEERKLPIYCVDCSEKRVALSFDAAWGNEDTKAILDILAKHNVHVTFFMTGGWVETYPDDVKAIAAAGHDQIGRAHV